MTSTDDVRPGSLAAAVVGTFDGVHLGHRYLIKHLLERSLTAGLTPRVYTFRTHPLSVINPAKAPAPLTSTTEKIRRLNEAGVGDIRVEDFTVLRGLTARQFISRLADEGVRLLVIGHDNRFGSDGLTAIEEFRDAAKGLPVAIEQAPELTINGCPVNSSAIRSLIAAGDVGQANCLLGYRYQITGNVISGRQLGRTLGFPTANIAPDDPSLLLPAVGVYAAEALTSQGRFPAMVNIGHRPTVDLPAAPISIEAHIIGLYADLYGSTVSVEPLSCLRSEMRFDTVDDLSRQLRADRDATLDFFARRQ